MTPSVLTNHARGIGAPGHTTSTHSFGTAAILSTCSRSSDDFFSSFAAPEVSYKPPGRTSDQQARARARSSLAVLFSQWTTSARVGYLYCASFSTSIALRKGKAGIFTSHVYRQQIPPLAECRILLSAQAPPGLVRSIRHK